VKERFFDLAHSLEKGLGGNEILICTLSGERSDFVRFNRGKVRQAGSVEQGQLSLRLIRDGRQATATVPLELEAARHMLNTLRDAVGELPEDPWLLINESPQPTSTERRGTLPSAAEATRQIVAAAKGRDLVGIYAAGALYRGFANSLGQRNWHEVDCFNLDWSLYLEADKAVKSAYAGFDWSEQDLDARVDAAARQLDLLRTSRRTIQPGEYRAYLAPRAMEELIGLLSWGGFSARARATKQSPLLRMQSGETLSPKLTVVENTADGIAPAFQSDGFIKPPRVPLIEGGAQRDALVSSRSAREYGLAPNAGRESPESLDIQAGDLALDEVLKALERGLYISNLWYLNYSDRPAGRITGMTRFATFWVEGGRIVAPITPMRFDDSVYRMLGTNLHDLTRERESLLDPSTYEERSTSSARLPGALLSGLKLTL
jgi:predicted Zn-dependent protease